MLIAFEGKRVIVAGAARGIGHAIAVEFAENGADVIACDRLVKEVEKFAGPAAIAEIFPTRTRSTWMTSGYALAVAIFGGFAPFISVWLISTFNSPIAHSFYLIGAAVVSTIVIATLRETAHEPLS